MSTSDAKSDTDNECRQVGEMQVQSENAPVPSGANINDGPPQEEHEVFYETQPTFGPNTFTRIPLPQMPQFNREDVDEWFRRLELQLQLIGAQNSMDQYKGLLSYLSGTLLMEAHQYLAEEQNQQNVANPYEFVKTKLLHRFGKSLRERMEDLMAKQPTDDLPSVFLGTLLRYAGCNNEALAREIWEDSLPDYMTAAVHSMRRLPVNAVAETADALHVATRKKRTVLNQVPEPVAAPQVCSLNTDLADRISRLEALLKKSTFKPKPQPKEKMPHVESNNSPARELCFYHRKFGDRARKCTCEKN